ncbi:hypothetical protein [Paracoccus saliphilus]|uniref:SAM-dependent methyltransferase n=1 Tax=Paracoccus saliphilus TaxID=405559 RepID=A0ABY7SG55_9RHOB|nr:hypothetical protein [Paracoccus saliphilus]WCR05062.1 hypothetical protein JHX88_10355 [Paracoccus saliphilus]
MFGNDARSTSFDDQFRRVWNFYLASCAACFLYETTDVTHVTVARPD